MGSLACVAKSLSENRLGEGDSPILLRGLRKIGTVPVGFRIGSPANRLARRVAAIFCGGALCGALLCLAVPTDALAGPRARVLASQRVVARFTSPEATFATGQQFLTQGKYEQFASCFSDEGLKELASYVHRAASSMAEVAGGQSSKPDLADFSRKMKVLLGHAAPAGLPKPAVEGEGPEWQSAANRTIGGAIKNPSAFVTAVFKIWAQSSATGPELKQNLRSIELHVDATSGPKALAGTSAGWLDSAPLVLSFRQVAGDWKIDSVVEPPPKKLVVADKDTWKAGGEQVVEGEVPAAGGGGGSHGSWSAGAKPVKIDYIKPDYDGPRNDPIYVFAQVVSSEQQTEHPARIRRGFVSVSSPTASEPFVGQRHPDGELEFVLSPGKYTLDFTAVGTRGETFEPKQLHYDLTAGPPKLSLGEVALRPTKFTRYFDRQLPDFPSDAKWRGSSPLTWDQLRGHVVLIQFCQHAAGVCMPVTAQRWTERYKSRGLVTILIHEPELQQLPATLRHTVGHAANVRLAKAAAQVVDAPLPTMIDVVGNGSFSGQLGVGPAAGMLLIGADGKLVSHLQPAYEWEAVAELEDALTRAGR